MQQGWLDYIAPQLYWRIDQTARSYPTLLQWWTNINSNNDTLRWGSLDASRNYQASKVNISRSLNKILLENIFFSVKTIKENHQGIAEKFKSLLYNEPALVPVMQ